MIGSLDFGPSSGKIILMGLKKFIFCPPGGKNFVHVEDVATACINAIDYGKSGENYIIGNEIYPITTSFKKLNRVQKRRALLFPFHLSFFILLEYLETSYDFLAQKLTFPQNMKILMIIISSPIKKVFKISK